MYLRYNSIITERKPKLKAVVIHRIRKTGMDVFTKKKRSQIMSRIRSKNTKAELIVFRELRKRKVYFQKHYKKIAGSPDIAIPRRKIAIFIDGDFWHGKNFVNTEKRLPKKYWREKIRSNIIRDKKNRVLLRRKGWKVLKVWESDVLRKPKNSFKSIFNFINKCE